MFAINFSKPNHNLFKRAAALHFLLFAIFTLANCRRANQPVQTDLPTHEVTDDLGRTIKIPQTIERAVSLAPNLTENIFAVGAGNKLVGVTSFCDYPEEAKVIPKIGDTINPNIETIIALKPNIVFVSTASQIENFTKTLEGQNIAVFITNPNDFEGILRNLKQLGDVLGTSAVAEKLIADLQNRVKAVEEKVKDKPKPKVFVQISKEPLFTVGKDSFITEIIERAGGQSATKDVATAYPKLSKETALALNPGAIILSESPDNLEPNDVFKNSDAVKNNRVFRVNAALLARPGPRIVDALELLAKDLHN
ncbi:MAG: cobalamin-binding protein [Pyrinomonadaceae bacterium]|nr:cobalamin-binding protein [Pyrinomonadaceae bacterium]